MSNNNMLDNLKETFIDLISFLKNPIDEAGPELSVNKKLKTLISLLIIEIPLMAVLILLISGLETLELVDPDNHKILDMINSYPVVLLLVLTVVIGPLIEELIFRLYLRYKNNYALHFLISIVSITGVRNEQKAETFLISLWKKRYKFIFYFSAVIFGLIHISNFEFSYTILLLSPILVAPQIILGLIIGYVRVRNGFVSGLLMHSLHNAFFIGIPLFFMFNDTEKLNAETSLYSIKIEETNDIAIPSTQKNYSDSIVYKNVSLKTTLTYLLNTNEILLKTNDKEMLDNTLNLNFKNKSKDSSRTKSIALNQLATSYDFKIKKSTKATEVWNLEVINPALLLKYKSNKNAYGNMITINPEEIIIKKSKINALINALMPKSNKMILDKTSSKDNYNFTLKTKDFISIKKQLKEKYGLSLVKQKINLEHMMIEFQKPE
ncbi:CPBP family intramembrane glutamic endopeptidase [Flavobacterium sp. DSR3-2]|uniref:CPBP family intramembrane glutamic endopeptidase n=1 Tax=Flavobacterium sp. DSR3-2 TaxID=2804634 RepID=UPI003CEA2BD0